MRTSASMTARITVRMSKARLRSALTSGEKISPTVRKLVPSKLWGLLRRSRSTGSLLTAGRAKRSPSAR